MSRYILSGLLIVITVSVFVSYESENNYVEFKNCVISESLYFEDCNIQLSGKIEILRDVIFTIGEGCNVTYHDGCDIYGDGEMAFAGSENKNIIWLSGQGRKSLKFKSGSVFVRYVECNAPDLSINIQSKTAYIQHSRIRAYIIGVEAYRGMIHCSELITQTHWGKMRWYVILNNCSIYGVTIKTVGMEIGGDISVDKSIILCYDNILVDDRANINVRQTFLSGRLSGTKRASLTMKNSKYAIICENDAFGIGIDYDYVMIEKCIIEASSVCIGGMKTDVRECIIKSQQIAFCGRRPSNGACVNIRDSIFINDVDKSYVEERSVIVERSANIIMQKVVLLQVMDYKEIEILSGEYAYTKDGMWHHMRWGKEVRIERGDNLVNRIIGFCESDIDVNNVRDLIEEIF